MKRRDVMVLGGLAALAGLWQVFGVRTPRLELTAIAGLPGWHFGSTGSLSGVSSQDFVTIGLDRGPAPLPASALAQAVHPDQQAGFVPVAVFTDFFCPYCRQLVGTLAPKARDLGIHITWHELPLLGPASVLVARAAEAAAAQNGYVEFYQALLHKGFRPSPVWMGTVADTVGLDGARLRQDMDGPKVAARLERSARAAATLGLVGTPGLVVGQTAILGALDSEEIAHLVAENRA